MPSKSQIPWLFAALLLGAYTHCVFSHAVEAADRHQQLRSDQQPLDNNRATCENESACICKGATLAFCVHVPVPELSLVDAVCVESAAEFLRCVAEVSNRRLPLDEGEPPLSGDMLRAQLQRFLL